MVVWLAPSLLFLAVVPVWEVVAGLVFLEYNDYFQRDCMSKTVRLSFLDKRTTKHCMTPCHGQLFALVDLFKILLINIRNRMDI